MSMLVFVVLPYLAFAVFLGGIAWRVARWARAPVPFRIPTTCGQQKSLPWIKSSWLESPWTAAGAAARVALEVLLFRSLFRNSRAELHGGPRLVYGESKYLWLGALVFHWSLATVLLRHLRFFTEPAPAFVAALQAIDGFLQIGTPSLYLSDVALPAGLAYLLYRRLADARIRYVSLFTDYFALALLMSIAATGLLMRYVTRVDVVAAKQWALSLVALSPAAPPNPGAVLYLHVLLVGALAVYFPFGKLVHMAGIFLSPTRNLANNNRMRRHVNPWNAPVQVHTYQEWEEEFHDKIAAAGLPLEGRS